MHKKENIYIGKLKAMAKNQANVCYVCMRVFMHRLKYSQPIHTHTHHQREIIQKLETKYERANGNNRENI